ncbi:MAG TPA: pyrroloquinoline quinone biosynthesis protein PqqE [Polyangiaceae bacterium]|jgi:pyrroloquinoline quinone biosynthesis protein E|nr:pyrroloquinoline quinone biosynthesis protein PqqE [Polyangiaceae bacterium]
MSAPRPYTLIAEVTYRCPLHCVYCSNPTSYRDHASELGADAWLRILDEAAALGVVQVHFTGGEPLARADLETLVERARARGLYTNLVTSGVPLERARLAELAERGVDHVQVSFQGPDAESSRAFAESASESRRPAFGGFADSFEQKLAVAAWTRELGLPLTVNVVLHAGNIERVTEIVALAERLGADRLELANVQLHGFAFENRALLLPSREALERARAIAAAAKQRFARVMDVLFVKPDWFSKTPRACMDGWARRFVQVLPDGTVVPCHAAATITSLSFERATAARSLGAIWETSPALQAFRGEAWMPEPCRSCDQKSIDFGGCRCQAFALLGDASRTDPACALSPDHEAVRRAALAPEPSRKRRFLFRGLRD